MQMMKKLKLLAKILAMSLILIGISFFLLTAHTTIVFTDGQDSLQKEIRGLWVATVVNIDYPSSPSTDPYFLQSEALKIIDYAKNNGFNAIFLQVRPCADAFYRSSIFPWSKYLGGKQGTAPSDDFDPLSFWINECHIRGIELHAWINPYRVTKKTSSEPKWDFLSLDPSNPSIKNPQWVIKHSDGNLYFNPGIPEVRKLIIDGALEIIQNYDVDGIHMDDYFYPDKSFDDKATYEQYGKNFTSIDDWRRENINLLIKEMSLAIKSMEKTVSFGISPFGIWANKKSNPLGSDTNGLQTYYDHYADTRKWVKEGWIDYIAPQLYWNIGFTVADYSKLLAWWTDTVKDTSVNLYIGHAAYRAGNQDPSSPWYGVAEISRQLALNEKNSTVKGSIFFSYNTLYKNAPLSAMIKAIFEKRDGFVSDIPVRISRPSNDIKTSLEKYYLCGSSDPSKPLYLNGVPVDGRSGQGFFGILVPLAPGPNVFTFSQPGVYDAKIIYKEVPSKQPQKNINIDIPASSVFPQSSEYRLVGDKIQLSCQAPAGSKVSVKLGSKTYPLKPSSSLNNGQLIKYSLDYTIPSFSGKARNVEIGTPIYTMNYKNTVRSRKAPAKIVAIMENSPFYAQIAKDVSYTYSSSSASSSVTNELYKGMTDNITAISNNFIRLASGHWIKNSDAKTYVAKNALKYQIKNISYVSSEKWDKILFGVHSSCSAFAEFDGTILRIKISPSYWSSTVSLPASSPFSKISSAKSGNGVEFLLSLKNGERIEGYYVESTSNGIVLNIKKRITVKNSEKPLSGITIMIDPGHGGSDSGAVGPLGLKYAEKTINLNMSLKLRSELEQLGAKVSMTREKDVYLSLEERLSASRKSKPDMFISIHANSMNDDVDISKIHGFSVFYRETHSKLLSQKIYDKVINDLGRNKHGVNNRNFYVVRGKWAPSLLIESGFVPNPYEFEWLVDDNHQQVLASTIARAISEYFSAK